MMGILIKIILDQRGHNPARPSTAGYGYTTHLTGSEERTVKFGLDLIVLQSLVTISIGKQLYSHAEQTGEHGAGLN